MTAPYVGAEMDELRTAQRELLLALAHAGLLDAGISAVAGRSRETTAIDPAERDLAELEARRQVRDVLRTHRAGAIATAIVELHAADVRRTATHEVLPDGAGYDELFIAARDRVTNARGTEAKVLAHPEAADALRLLVGALLVAETCATDGWVFAPLAGHPPRA